MSPPSPHLRKVTADWLAAVLSTADTEVVVENLRVDPVGVADGGTVRLTPAYVGSHAGLPASLLLKTPPVDTSLRRATGPGRRTECAFYASVADRVTVPVPACHHCETPSDTDDFMLLLADPAPVAAVGPDGGCDEARARLAVTAIAGLHAPTWCTPEWLRFPGLRWSLPDSAAANAFGENACAVAELAIERFGSRMAAEDASTLVEAMDRVTPWVSAVLGRYSLLHGDYRVEHVLFAADRPAVWVADWQTLAVGLPARDVACFAGTALDPDVRSAAEHDLVTAYHRELVAGGVTDYDLETCWHDYRYAMIQAPLSCAQALAGTVPDDRAQRTLLTMLHRACEAVRDLQTLGLVDEVAAAERAVARHLTHVNVH